MLVIRTGNNMEKKQRLKEQLEDIGTAILENARNELYVSMRFFDAALGSFSFQMNQQTFYMGTDGETIYFNGKFLMERFEYNKTSVNRSYLHMVLHCMFRHLYEQKEREEEIWNIACDILVEYLIDQIGSQSVAVSISPDRELVYEQLGQELHVFTAEGIYYNILENKLSFDQNRLLALFINDDHSFWNRKKKEDKKNQSEQLKHQEEKWKKLSEQIETSLDIYFRQIGRTTGKLVKVLSAANREKQSYEAFLRKFAAWTEELKIDEEEFDYGYYYYGLTYYNKMPFVEPLEYKEAMKINELVIAIDTSGSCSGELIKQFLKKTFAILKETSAFEHKIKIHVIQCDNEIKEDWVIEDLEEINKAEEEFTIKGHGGTDFRPVFEYIEELRHNGSLMNLKGLLYFTDGYGIYPKMRTDYNTAFLFLEGDYSDEMVPSWAMKFVWEKE